MFDWIRKPEIWRALDAGLLPDTKHALSFQLKTMQDLCILQLMHGIKGTTIAEIGGGASRVLPTLTQHNQCFNIEPFEGADNGPTKEITLPNVTNILATVGTSQSQIADASYDYIFSISVVEHVPDEAFQDFFEDCIRLLKPGGVMYHAVDMYIAEEPTDFWRNRFDMYRNAITAHPAVTPIGEINRGDLKFTTDIATNPDNIMHGWKQISPDLDHLRQMAQSVSLKIGARRKH